MINARLMSAIVRAKGRSSSSGSGGSIGEPKAASPPHKAAAVIVKWVGIEITAYQNHFAGFHSRR
jgi:hypothetical protein